MLIPEKSNLKHDSGFFCAGVFAFVNVVPAIAFVVLWGNKKVFQFHLNITMLHYQSTVTVSLLINS